MTQARSRSSSARSRSPAPRTDDHYFGLFLSPVDVVLSFFKVLVLSVLVNLSHCYYAVTDASQDLSDCT